MQTIRLTKHIFGDLRVESPRLTGVFGPKAVNRRGLSDADLVERLRTPIGTPPLVEMAKSCRNALIVTDDNTRLTPLERIVPHILSELKEGGLNPENITILIGLGTHRPMTEDEILEKFGQDVTGTYAILNHKWQNTNHLQSLGPCDLGFEVIINRLVGDADLVISAGSIIPHATAGFSGGGKTIMPGVCGERTIEETHWAALAYSMRDILGNPDNRVRQAIVSICREIGLRFIVNTILMSKHDIYDLVAGDVDLAHRRGIELSREVYGVDIPARSEIVIAEAYPTDIDLRQSIKAICSADLVCKDGGVIILPAECREGISPQFPDFKRYGFRNPEKLYQDVETGIFRNKLLAYTLVAIGRIISTRLRAILVSPNISRTDAEQLGFYWAPDLQSSFELALKLTHAGAKVTVLNQAGEILPVLLRDDEIQGANK